MQLTIPTLLTLMRIALIPVFVVVFYLPVSWANWATTLIFILAAFTDWLDGFLARRLKATSRFGAFLDPVADKLMVTTTLVLIVDLNPLPFNGIWLALPAAIIVGREITISALREWMAEVGATSKVAVSFLGKIKTSAQMAALVFLLYHEPIAGVPTALVGFALLYVAAIMTIWSMFRYLRAAWPVLAAREHS